jgi:hypothetical protein
VLWLYQKEFLIREGYAWVGVSAQDGGMSRAPNGPKIVNAKRYASIDLTAGGTVTDASLNFDIYSQAGAAVKHVPEVLGGLKYSMVIAAGQSQSAGRMGPYLNGVHSRAPIYDAAMLTVNNQKMRTDLTIPVIKVLSENRALQQPQRADLRKCACGTSPARRTPSSTRCCRAPRFSNAISNSKPLTPARRPRVHASRFATCTTPRSTRSPVGEVGH